MAAPDTSIVMLSWNTRDYTRAALQALERVRAAGRIDLEAIVIDNASEDDSVAAVAGEFPWVRLYRNAENVGYARGVNQGLRLARGRTVTLLGSDTEVRPGTLETMLAFLDAHPDVGAVAPRLVDPDGTAQRACMRFPDLKTALWYDTPLEAWKPDNRVLDRYHYRDWSHDEDREVDQPPGTCLMVRRETIDEIGPMDRRLWLFFNDVDWCLRMRRAGWRIWYLHHGTEVLHHVGGSTRRFRSFPFEWHRNRLAFYRKHHRLVGSAIVKCAILWVGVREIVRIRRNLESTREFLAHARQVAVPVLREILVG